MLLNNEDVVFTGGIGDVLAIDSFFTEEERCRLRRIFWATRRRPPLQTLLAAVQSFFPNLTEQVSVWEHFQSFPSFHKAKQIRPFLKKPPPGFTQAQDLSIHYAFKTIMRQQLPCQGSCLLRQALTPLTSFQLPRQYLCVVPGSGNYARGRNFSKQEWLNLQQWLQHTGQVGVLLGTEEIACPLTASCFINLLGKTTIVETVEILKGGTGYIGVDSWPAVLACQLFPASHLLIKSKNIHYFVYKEVYCAPKKDYSFVVNQISPLGLDPLLASRPATAAGDDSLQWCYLHDYYYDAETAPATIQSLQAPPVAFCLDLVTQYCGTQPVVEVGATDFVSQRPYTLGFTTLPALRDTLEAKHLFFNPWLGCPEAIKGMCLWGSLPTVAQPSILFNHLSSGTFLFLAVPILPQRYRWTADTAQVLQEWDHYRPGQALHYWTAPALKNYAGLLGLTCLEERVIPERTDLWAFVFVKE